ncbi:MAG: HAD-IIIA family hydrolase [Chloroflexi bacterium]|nr:HAD-IIIA family hydrolase [Chloroflexota bacterium]
MSDRTKETGQVTALLLGAGLGTRLRPLTDTIPKCLVPIGGQPLLAHWIDRLEEAGVATARINTHAHPEQVRAFLQQHNARGGPLRIDEFHEPTLLGSAGTVAANPNLADGHDAVLIIYTDNYSDVDLGALLAYHRGHSDPLTMLLFRAANPRACGIAELDAAGRIVAFVEKPENPASDLANAGVYVVDASAYREMAAQGAFDLGFDVLPRFVGRMRGWLWEGHHRDVGTPEALVQARIEAPLLRHCVRRRQAAPPQPAVFLDRDGTLIEHVHYLRDPAEVRLIPGAPEALARLRDAGYALVLVTNQSAVGRGMLSIETLDEIHAEMNRQLAAHDVALDAIEYCPVAPAADGDRTAIDHPDRKPAPGMLLRAAAGLGLDLPASWMIGDMISDALAGRNAGCHGVLLVRTGNEPPDAEAAAHGFEVLDDLAAAADHVLAERRATTASRSDAS